MIIYMAVQTDSHLHCSNVQSWYYQIVIYGHVEWVARLSGGTDCSFWDGQWARGNRGLSTKTPSACAVSQCTAHQRVVSLSKKDFSRLLPSLSPCCLRPAQHPWGQWVSKMCTCMCVGYNSYCAHVFCKPTALWPPYHCYMNTSTQVHDLQVLSQCIPTIRLVFHIWTRVKAHCIYSLEHGFTDM